MESVGVLINIDVEELQLDVINFDDIMIKSQVPDECMNAYSCDEYTFREIGWNEKIGWFVLDVTNLLPVLVYYEKPDQKTR